MALTREQAERAEKVVRMRDQGMTFQAIATELGLRSKSWAHDLYTRTLREGPALALAEHRAAGEIRLRRLIAEAWKLYEKRYPVVSFGKVFFEAELPDGSKVEIEDVGPKLAALKEIRMLDESLRRLLGTDAPTRHRVEFVPEDAVDAEIRRTAAEAGMARAEEAEIAEIERWLQAQDRGSDRVADPPPQASS